MPPWVLAQTVERLLSLHHPCPPGVVDDRLPSGVEPDLFDGAAWVSVMAMRVTGVHPRLLPAVPRVSAYPQVNVRTFVRWGPHRAVWFLSLDAPSATAVWLGRTAFGLPYHRASVSFTTDDGVTAARSRRRDGEATFAASWSPRGTALDVQPGSLDEFLGERDEMVCSVAGRRVRWGRVQHTQPAVVHEAEAQVEASTMLIAAGLARAPGAAPVARYCAVLPSVAWLPRRSSLIPGRA